MLSHVHALLSSRGFRRLFLALGLYVALHATSAATAETLVTPQLLREAQAKINAGEAPYCYPKHSNAREDMSSGRYASYYSALGGQPTLAYPFCLHTKELGNRLGNYFAEVTCAAAAGLHFVAVHKTFDLQGSHNNATDEDGRALPHPLHPRHHDRHRRAFLDALPDVLVHPAPAADLQTARQRVAEKCRCRLYCWGDPRHRGWTTRRSSRRSCATPSAPTRTACRPSWRRARP